PISGRNGANPFAASCCATRRSQLLLVQIAYHDASAATARAAASTPLVCFCPWSFATISKASPPSVGIVLFDPQRQTPCDPTRVSALCAPLKGPRYVPGSGPCYVLDTNSC